MNETADVIRINAMIQELSTQRSIAGNRAAELAGANAILKAENEALRKRLEELEKPKEPAE